MSKRIKTRTKDVAPARATPPSNASLQRQLGGKSTQQVGGPALPAAVHDVLRTTGEPLDAKGRALMEPGGGHDFSRVHVIGPTLRAAGEGGPTPAGAPAPAAPAPAPAPEEEKKPPGGTTFQEPIRQTYAVTATTLAEAAAEIGKREEAGETKARPDVDWTTSEGRVISAIVTIPVTVTMPSWPGAEKLSPAAKAEWDRFYAALEAHEQEHIATIHSQLSGLGESLVGKTEAEAKLALEEADKKLEAAMAAHDLETDHGRKTGTTVDSSIQ